MSSSLPDTTGGGDAPAAASTPAHGNGKPGEEVVQARGSHGSARSAEYYPLFDYLRFALAMGVFVVHSAPDGVLPEEIGNACVQVFFALSGFLIGGILVRNRIKDLPRFFFNRTTRIWIPYFVAVGILLLGTIAKRQPFDGKLLEYFFYKVSFVWNLFGVPQLEAFQRRMPLDGTGNHFWSVCVEEQFYLIAPLVIVLLPRGRVVVLLLAWLVNFVFPHHFASISLGVLLALSQHRYGDWFAKASMRAILLVLLGLSVTAMVTGLMSYYVVIPIGSVCVVALLARRGGQRPLGQLLGGVSYPFYLNQWVGLVMRKQLERSIGVSALGSGLIALVIALGFSTTLYLLVDRNIQKYRSRWYSPRVGLVCTWLAGTLFVVGLLGGLAFHLWPPP